MSPSPELRATRRQRPKDRKEQIARASAEAFSSLGYHGVRMEEIAGRVGVTAASLYRHYARKYDLFRVAVLELGEQMVQCTAFVDDADDSNADGPKATWDRLPPALIDRATRNRVGGG